MTAPPRYNAFVDDIFISLQPSSSGALTDTDITRALLEAVGKLNITFKICQVCQGPGFVRHRFSPGTSILRPCPTVTGPAAMSVDEKVCKVEAVTELEVLGTVFYPPEGTLRMKDTFCARALDSLSLDVETIPLTPLLLWRIAGLCFHVTYALGMGLARFRPTLRLIGRVATEITGATQRDPRWRAKIPVCLSDRRNLAHLMKSVSAFPTVKFESNVPPLRHLITDACFAITGLLRYGPAHGVLKKNFNRYTSVN